MHQRKDQILHQKARRLIEEKIISQKRRTFDKTPTLHISITTRVHTYVLEYILRETGETRKEAGFLLNRIAFES